MSNFIFHENLSCEVSLYTSTPGILHYSICIAIIPPTTIYTFYHMQGASVGQLFKKVKEVVPTLQCNQQLRLIMGEIDFRENSTQTLQDTGVRHGSSVFAVIRTVGGSDPRITWLFECKEKVITGVRTPSLRACPHCGALVEHSAACKHMKCPACGKEFCFICLSKRDEKGVWIPLYGQTGWQCGRYNTSCNPAPRQTNIPG